MTDEPSRFDKKRMYWLDGFEGAARGGTFYRSRIALDIEEFETKFDVKVVAIGIERDAEHNGASWTIEFITEVPEGEVN